MPAGKRKSPPGWDTRVDRIVMGTFPHCRLSHREERPLQLKRMTVIAKASTGAAHFPVLTNFDYAETDALEWE